jgi:flagellar hook-associated protein 1 FlgK
MSISALFNSASSSLAAQRVALDVTAENISNVNTEGYSRQRVVMETAPTTTHNGFPLGSGVKVAIVQRMYDNVLNKQINDGTTLQGNNDTKLQTLQQIEPYLNELSGNSIGDAMQGLSDSWQALSLNPSGLSERQTVLGKAQVLVDTFHQVRDGIVNAQTFTDQSLTAVASDVTSTAREIADLNMQIRTTELISGNANEIRDRRDLLLQQLSRQVGISYAEQPDGMMDVKLPGGETLVTGNTYATVYTNAVGPGVTTNEIRITAAGAPPLAANPATDTNVTASIGGSGNSKGEIGGLLYMRDTSLPAYLGKLDELAYNLSYQVNTQHAAGWNLNNNTNIAFFSPATAAAPPAPLAAYTGYSAAISVAITNTNDIAAADTNPLTGGVGNNKNALLLAGVANTKVAFSVGVMSSTVDYYNSLVASVGVDVRSSKNLTAQNESFVRQLNNLRDSNSGVSLDEELTNLIKYQKAFEGASKVISTASQMMDTLLGLIR